MTNAKRQLRMVVPLLAAAAVLSSSPAAVGHHGSNHVGGGPSSNMTPAPFSASIGPFLLNPVRLLSIEADLNGDGDTNDPNERAEAQTPPLALGGKLILTVYKFGGTEPGATIQRCPGPDGPGAIISVSRTAPNAGGTVEIQDHNGATVLKREVPVSREGGFPGTVEASVC